MLGKLPLSSSVRIGPKTEARSTNLVTSESPETEIIAPPPMLTKPDSNPFSGSHLSTTRDALTNQSWPIMSSMEADGTTTTLLTMSTGNKGHL